MDKLNASILEAILLALWLGAAVFFSVAVAPALFAVLPTRTLAGIVVGRVLPMVFYSGMVVGVCLIGLQVVARSGWVWGTRELSGIVIIGACAVAQFIVGPRIQRLREEIGGPLEQLAADDVRRAAFGRLHGISVAWLGLAMLASVTALVIAARSLSANTDV